MTSRLPFPERDKLERAYTKSESVWQEMPRLTSILTPIWKQAATALAPLHEPRIRQICGPDGTLTYFAYDPVTGSRHLFSSEESLRLWLAQRYRD
ncbi:hypothetical protein [Synechococcus sp. PCC 7336]|uniref:hypothetical protein n=1 Tax=Synechococcus sp. PCC 7336 TaxID=195250 RepID=UPI000345719F|nr:hypothetical protein [Synechococcus sp. PCC 7336]